MFSGFLKASRYEIQYFCIPSSTFVPLESSYFHLIGNGSLSQETTEVAKLMTGLLAQDLQAVGPGRETIHFSGPRFPPGDMGWPQNSSENEGMCW